MGLTSAMFTGLSGLNTNQFMINTIGDNIANVNTTAFKESRASFENQFALTLSGGSGPAGASGGTNPVQVGRGSSVGGVQRNMEGSGVEATGVPTNMAIEGAGFFVVRTPENEQAYTRDGTFKLDADHNLVTVDGYRVQGYGVDANYQIVPDTLVDLNIPLGTLSTARATTEASFDGNLNANGTVATQGTILASQTLEQAPGVAATGASLLTSLSDAANPGVPLFAAGDVITLSGISRGGRDMPDAQMTVTATTTLDELLTLINNNIGINSDPNAPGTPGVTVNAAGQIVLEGNAGSDNAISIPASSIRSSNPGMVNPLLFTQQQAANGESLYTTFTAYDSLGTPVRVGVTLTLESKTNAGTTWRFYGESRDDTDGNPILGPTGTISFDTDGRLTSVTGNTIQIDRNNTGAAQPLQMDLDFSEITGLTTQTSSLVMTTQDGYSTGTLTNFAVGPDGVITGTFSNGLTRQLGQVALAMFTNPGGLVSATSNLYLTGANSGQPIITAPQTFGAGQVIGGSLELSNVDLTREFIGLITATTGFSASGRVISTSNDMLNELLMLAR